MKVGVIAPPWLPVPPGRYGGTENVIDGLCRGLQAQGHQVLLVATMGSRCPVPTIALRVDGDGNTATAEASYALRAYAALEDAGVDVIHDHTRTGFLIARPSFDQPILTTNHNLFDAERSLIYDEAAARGVWVVAISNHHASTADQAGVHVAGVVHNGIDVAAIPVGQGDGGYAAVLSRMSPDKGVREAILIARNAGMPLRIAAKMQTPLEHQYFRERIYPLLGGDIEYVGEVGVRGKYELLGAAVALLNPIQWNEPFGLAAIEAMACGTPVLATGMGSMPEIITHGVTGMLRGHWSGLPADLERIDALDRAACRREAEQRFGIDRMAAEYAALYQAALPQERAVA
jgi:glycosyltransferase involved in cell wall biosynthesis